MIVLISGVSGTGKSTISRLLSQKTGWPCIDADDFHSNHAKEKMGAGVPLNDDDRQEWLENLHTHIQPYDDPQHSAILACSALTNRYRSILLKNMQHVFIAWLEGDFELIKERIQSRPGHFFPSTLLQSQFDLAEPPVDGPTYNIAQSPEIIVSEIYNDIYELKTDDCRFR